MRHLSPNSKLKLMIVQAEMHFCEISFHVVIFAPQTKFGMYSDGPFHHFLE
jgi:hypothetical protein